MQKPLPDQLNPDYNSYVLNAVKPTVVKPTIEHAPIEQAPTETEGQLSPDEKPPLTKAEAAWFKYYDERFDNKSKVGRIAVTQLAAVDRKFFSLKNQLRSMAFGLVCAGIVIVVCSFTLFNEMIITPFIRPGGSIQSPVVNEVGVPLDSSPKVRIPKINVDIPVVYDLSTTDEKQFELALDGGIVRYPTTALPGQAGNTVYFGHSSNNIFNPGKYKFAFVLLRELVSGDTFYLTYGGKLYTYEVISRQVVKPTDFSVLSPVAGQAYTATLITCDPPGTSTNRLAVVGKQISPVPGDTAATTDADTQTATNTPTASAPEAPSTDKLPGNGPGLLTRMWRSVFGE